MRTAIAFCLLVAFAHSEARSEPITVVLQAPESASPAAMDALKTEMRAIMHDSGVELNLRESNVRTGEVFPDLIVVKLTGRCATDAMPVMFDERGPEGLAFTHSSDRYLLPFAEVPCDRVRAAIRTAMWGDDYRRANFLLGRALARVISHEFYHILAKTKAHGRTGIAQHTLSAYQLISDKLRLDAPDANLIRMRSLPPAPHRADLP